VPLLILSWRDYCLVGADALYARHDRKDGKSAANKRAATCHSARLYQRWNLCIRQFRDLPHALDAYCLGVKWVGTSPRPVMILDICITTCGDHLKPQPHSCSYGGGAMLNFACSGRTALRFPWPMNTKHAVCHTACPAS
jgi:hypothetical protein